MEGKFSSPRNSADYIREGTPPPRRKPQKRRRRLNPNFIVLCIIVLVLLLVLIFSISSLLRGCTDSESPLSSESSPTDISASPSESSEPTEPFEPVVSTATISVTGDVLMHMPVINSCLSGDTYDFTGIFQYLDDYAAEADYAVANLETTLAGSGNGYAYSGYPCFNCPDAIADALKNAGFDMLLTSNNHCYDTRTLGLTRTLQVAADAGLDTLGTQATAEAADYAIVDLNGIQVGMMCYSYATSDSYPDRPSMNGILTGTEASGMINYFDYDQLDQFYADVSACITAMETAGADTTVLYIHWGQEYQLSANANQTAIAQQLCDLGIDVIVGGHPHVVQPMELLTSTTDENHKTVCLYSMGNAVSNQRRENMNLSTGHTEDGVLFSFSFTQYADGEVLLDSVNILPTWVHMDTAGGTRTYRILPLDQNVTDWSAAYGISASVAASAQESYDRTMNLVDEGLTAAQNYLTALREAKLTALTQSNT